MLAAGVWTPNQQNTILFVMVDNVNNEVTGLGSGFTVEISKGGAAFQASAGVKAEVGSGWYSYTTTAAEADTYGPVAIKVTDASAVQQNLEYVVGDRSISAIEFTYTVTDSSTGLPIEGVEVWFATDSSGSNVAWYGTTDAFGVARNDGNLPRLDTGTYYVFRQKAGYTFSDPDTEVVS